MSTSASHQPPGTTVWLLALGQSAGTETENAAVFTAPEGAAAWIRGCIKRGDALRNTLWSSEIAELCRLHGLTEMEAVRVVLRRMNYSGYLIEKPVDPPAGEHKDGNFLCLGEGDSGDDNPNVAAFDILEQLCKVAGDEDTAIELLLADPAFTPDKPLEEIMLLELIQQSVAKLGAAEARKYLRQAIEG